MPQLIRRLEAKAYFPPLGRGKGETIPVHGLGDLHRLLPVHLDEPSLRAWHAFDDEDSRTRDNEETALPTASQVPQAAIQDQQAKDQGSEVQSLEGGESRVKEELKEDGGAEEMKVR